MGNSDKTVEKAPLKLRNFSVEQFNRDVNVSHDPDGQFQRWAGYRKQIRAFLEKTLNSGENSGHVIVLGAGSLNDVDLPLLCDSFEKVTLTDIDISSMLQGLVHHQLTQTQRDKITLRTLDYSSAQDSGFFQMLESLACASASVETIIAAMENVLAQLKPESLPIEEGFDCILSCPVYTQLVYTQIEVWLKILFTYGLYPLQDLNRILTVAHEGMTALLQNYNQWMLSLLKQNGKIIVLADILELNADDPLLVSIRNHPEHRLSSTAIQNRIDSDGLGFTKIGLKDLEKRIVCTDSDRFLWPFDEHKSYLVIGQAGVGV